MSEPGGEIPKVSSAEVTNSTAPQLNPEKVGRGRALASALKERLGLGKRAPEGASSTTPARSVLKELAGEKNVPKRDIVQELTAIDQITRDPALSREQRREQILAIIDAGVRSEQQVNESSSAARNYTADRRGSLLTRVGAKLGEFSGRYSARGMALQSAVLAVAGVVTHQPGLTEAGLGMTAFFGAVDAGVTHEYKKADRAKAELDKQKTTTETTN